MKSRIGKLSFLLFHSMYFLVDKGLVSGSRAKYFLYWVYHGPIELFQYRVLNQTRVTYHEIQMERENDSTSIVSL